jgi:hypothetical protein
MSTKTKGPAAERFRETKRQFGYATRTGAGVVFGGRPTTWKTLCPKTTPAPLARNATRIHSPVLTLRKRDRHCSENGTGTAPKTGQAPGVHAPEPVPFSEAGVHAPEPGPFSEAGVHPR